MTEALQPPSSTAAASTESKTAPAPPPTPPPPPRARVIISHLEGTLLRDPSFFPYYILVALEAGSPARAFLLLLLSPLTFLLPECRSIQLLVFVATAGLKLSAIRGVSAAILPKFFLDDLDPTAYRTFLKHHAPSTSRRCVASSHPLVFVEHFLRTYLRADTVLATELAVTKNGTCTGFVAKPGVFMEDTKLESVKLELGKMECDGYGLCDVNGRHHAFLSLCQETVVISRNSRDERVPREEYLTPFVFHDGRLVSRPTPMAFLAVALWVPFGLALAVMRILVGLTLPQELAFPLSSFLGVKLRVKGAPPLLPTGDATVKEGILFVCVHRSLADPIFLAMALRRKVRALVFSVSKISQILSPVNTTRLTRNRNTDTEIIDRMLEKEDLCICPEGTTCREPYLLRFSPLFADLADRLVPVAVNLETNIFHGSTARGHKSLDGFFLAMNPRISYEISFLEMMSIQKLHEGGKSAVEIANLVQKKLGAELGFECTNYNRKDKYSLLAGNDGN